MYKKDSEHIIRLAEKAGIIRRQTSFLTDCMNNSLNDKYLSTKLRLVTAHILLLIRRIKGK